MTVLTAYQSLSTISPGPFFSSFVALLLNNPPEVRNGYEVKVAAGPFEVDIRGSGFGGFFHNIPTKGTINSIHFNFLGPYFTLSGMHVPISTLAFDLGVSFPPHAPNYSAALSLFLPGHDRIIGSPGGGDHLPDRNGHDTVMLTGPFDVASGGGGADRFVFHPNYVHETINHFIAGTGPTHDVLDFRGFGAVTVSWTFEGNGTILIHDSLGSGETITLTHVSGAFSAHDISFL